MKLARRGLFVLIIAACASAVFGDISSTERQALIDLYNSTNGDNWMNNSGWKEAPLDTDGFAMPGTEGGWYGITVDGGNTTVEGIDLSNNNLTGSLPIGLDNLANLISADFYYNHLTGSIPFENVTSLQYLNLANNSLSTTLPMELGNLTGLATLHLENNMISGGIPSEIGNLSELEYLNISGNQLWGSLPPELGNLSHLATLDLRNNRLWGAIPAELGNLSSLENLNLGTNELTGSLPAELGNLGSLRILNLRLNHFTGSIPPELGNCSNLEFINIRSSQLTGTIPAELGNCGNLYGLSLCFNPLTGTIPAEIGNLTNLELLVLEGSQLTGEIPSSLTNCTLLTPGSLYLDYNALYTTNAALITFLNTNDPTWGTTQTVAPTNMNAAASGEAEVTVSWTPIVFTDYTGGYRVYFATESGGPYTFYDQTADKNETSLTITGLTAGLPYYFVVQTRTDPHTDDADENKNNPNTVDSEYSTEVTATPSYTTHIPTAERQALIDLYNATAGDSWTNNSGWKTAPIDSDGFAMPGTEGGWYGVGLDGAPSVISINLNNNNLVGALPLSLDNLISLNGLNLYNNVLSGSIPAELGSLDNLTGLNLGRNQLSGAIPGELGNLTNLQHLFLQSNQLSGSIPPELGNLSSLERLYLDQNPLGGSIPSELGNLAHLYELSLTGSQLTGNIPAEIGNLNNLYFLNLAVNQLTGPIPPELGNMAAMQSLYLDGNRLSGGIPGELGNLTSLAELWLANNPLTGEIPAVLGSLGNLQSLWLANDQLTGAIPAELGNLTNLIEFVVNSNQLTGGIPPELGNMSAVVDFELQNNQLTGGVPSELGNLTNLRYLYLNANQLTGSLPVELAGLTNLTDLILHNNQLTGNIPPELGNLANLLYLYLGRNQFTGNIPPELGNLSHLLELLIWATQIGGNIPPEIEDLTSLQYLSFENNQLTGSIPVELGQLTSLTNLELDKNQLSGNIPVELGNLTNLTDLWLDNNQLSGSIPAEIGNLKKLVRLYLHSNGLSGDIPSEIGNLGKVQVLSLHSNLFTGSIPPSIGRMYALTELYLSDNRLSGNIPTELGNRGGLMRLYLDSNNLSGPIPESMTRLYLLDSLTTDFGYNALYSTDATLTAFLNTKDPDWESTQTVAPASIRTVSFNASTIILSWDTIPYVGDTGGYLVHYGTSSGGPYTLYAQTADKSSTEQIVTGLTEGVPYYFVVQTQTDAHINNQNTVVSDYSSEASNTPDGSVVIPAAERQALIDLYNATGGDSWTDNSGWKAPPLDADGFAIPGTEENWYGVNLDGTPAVASINLGSNNLVGTLPSSLGDLGELTNLNLRNNAISGSIPNTIGNLTNLTNLTFYNNQLTDSIPAGLGNLVNLTNLNLSTNQLSGVIPGELGNLTNLQYLHLQSNRLSGYIPAELGGLSACLELILNNNQLSGSIPPELGNLTNCVSLYLYNNQLSGSIPAELGGLAACAELILHRNQLSGSIPAELGNLTNVVSLYLQNNQLSGNIPAELGQLSACVELILNTNQLSGSIPTELGSLTNCVSLYLHNNLLSGSIPAELGGLTNVVEFILANNLLTGSLPPELGNMTAVADFEVQNNQLTGSIPAELGNLANLQWLYLNGNQLSGTLPPELGNLANLLEFNLNVNQVGGDIPIELGDLNKLQTLILGRNRFTGTIPAIFDNMPDLNLLGFHCNQLTGTIPPEIGNLTQLNTIFLSDNQLTGEIPPELGSLTNLDVLGLDSNQLSGNIPEELGALANLTVLWLQDNQLTGSIPASFGNLKKLVRLYLYANELSGDIPPELGNIGAGLQVLSLHSNRLTGSIPVNFRRLGGLLELALGNNKLTGGIPMEIGEYVRGLTQFSINSNALTGEIPTSLTKLFDLDPIYTNFGYNALYSNDATLTAFLNEKDPDWDDTQTIAPTDVAATAAGQSAIVSWTPIAYTGDAGGYRIYYGTTSGGPYTLFGQTADKSAASLPVSGLTPGLPYYFVVQTQTDAHTNNQNVLQSAYSEEAAATPVDLSLTITSPNGGEAWISGSTQNVTWTTSGTVDNVKLEYSLNGGGAWTTIIASTPNAGTYPWTLPAATSSTNCRVRVSEAAGGTPSDTSNAAFSIGQLAISGTVKVGGTGLANVVMAGLPGSPATNASGFYTAAVDYGWDGTAAPTLAGYTFTPASTTYADVAVNTTTNYTAVLNTYTISGNVTAGGSGLANVTMSGLTGSPKTDASGFYTATVNYNWSGTVTPTLAGYGFSPSSRTYANVTAAYLGQNYAASNNALTITTPNDGEEWSGGTSHNITWTTAGSVANVKLEYTSNGTTWTQIVASTPNANTYAWTVPSINSTTCKVRVSNVADATCFDTSDNTFTITTGTFAVTSPNGGEVWHAGSTHDITWTTTGSAANVKLEYSTDGGTSWTTIIASTPDAMPKTRTKTDGKEAAKPMVHAYAWTLPAVASTACRVKISDAADGSPSDTSNANFTIKKERPIIGLSKTTFNFAAVQKGKTTPPDSVLVTNLGGGTLKWTAVSGTAWLAAGPKSGTAGKSIKIKVVKTSGLPVGTYQALISVVDPNATNSPQNITVNLVVKAAGSDAVPFGEFETPADGASVNTATIAVSGWALDDVGMKAAKIYNKVSSTKKTLVGTAKFIAGARPDIEASHPTYPQNHKAGWSYTLTMKKLPGGGVGTYTLMAYVQDVAGQMVLLGEHTITGVAPGGGAAPFGEIESPADGGTVSGREAVIKGWAMAPMSNRIAGGGLTLWVDGMAAGHSDYGAFRKDLGAKAGALSLLDTAKYVDGWHTLAWSVEDSTGIAGEIGSRYFKVQNKAEAAGLSETETGEDGSSPVIENEEQAAKPVSEIASFVQDGITPVYVKRGFTDGQTAETLHPDEEGSIKIQIPQASRLAIYLNQGPAFENEVARMTRTERILAEKKDGMVAGDAVKSGDGSSPLFSIFSRYEAYVLVGEELRPLPIGASFDGRDGILFWQPGPGFLGEHRFVIADSETMTRRIIHIIIK